VEAFQLGTLAEERWPITRSTRVDPAVRADRRRSSGPPHGSRFACQGRGHILRPQTIEDDVTSSSQFGPRRCAYVELDRITGKCGLLTLCQRRQADRHTSLDGD